jgi:5-methylcytosine-specific restriction endonuclease McrA
MSERPLCTCGRPCQQSGKRNNKKYWKKHCNDCGPKGRNIYRSQKKDTCEQCGFIPLDKCQLDVDHVDGNKQNNSPENLQTLCANCHRLKTHKNKDYLSKV